MLSIRRIYTIIAALLALCTNYAKTYGVCGGVNRHVVVFYIAR